MMPMRNNDAYNFIARRAVINYAIHGVKMDLDCIIYELKLCHEEICPLRLRDLCDAKPRDLMHDVCGIHQHMDILDGSFRECFRPRYAKKR